MLIKELIKKLQTISEKYVYINSEKNIEDEFVIVEADTGNILFVPLCKIDELKNSQLFSFKEI